MRSVKTALGPDRALEAAARRAYTRRMASLWEKIRNWLGIGKKKT